MYKWNCTYLSGLINEDNAESELCEARVPSPNTCGADHISILQQLSFTLPLQGTVPLLIGSTQLTLVILQLLQLTQLLVATGRQESTYCKSQIFRC